MYLALSPVWEILNHALEMLKSYVGDTLNKPCVADS